MTTISKNAGPYSRFTSACTTFNSATSVSVDPGVEFSMRRVILLRHMFCKRPSLRSVVDRILSIYHNRQVNGIECAPEVIAAMTPAPRARKRSETMLFKNDMLSLRGMFIA